MANSNLLGIVGGNGRLTSRMGYRNTNVRNTSSKGEFSVNFIDDQIKRKASKVKKLLTLIFLLNTMVFGASFDCEKASSNVEKMICEKPQLYSLNEKLVSAFNELTKQNLSKEKLQKEYASWMQERDACMQDTCLLAFYRERINLLNESLKGLDNAILANNAPSVNFLVNIGADVNVSSKEGKNIYSLIIDDPYTLKDEPKNNEQKILKLLQALGDKLNPNANFDDVLDQANKKHTGFSLLHYACRKSYKDMVLFLLKKGANVNAEEANYIYETPIKNLFIRGKVSKTDEEIANILLDRGADKSGLLALATSAYASEQLIKRLGGGEIHFKPKRDNSKEIVTVFKDNLTWQDNKDVKSVRLNWKRANDYCKNLILGGYDDWKLPNKDEFNTIFDGVEMIPGFVNTTNECYWTSNSNVYAEGFSPTWLFSFNYDTFCVGDQKALGNVRCVRNINKISK